jgi:formate dehydrogenase subunit gamma
MLEDQKSKKGKGVLLVSRRVLVGVVIAAAFVLGVVYAWRIAFVDGTALLFNSGWWLVLLAPFAGILAAGRTRRKDPVVEGERVLRHDDAAILEHWTHGIGTAVLLVTGFSLGALFIPSLLSKQQAWAAMNIHFVAVVMFLFGTFYYGTNTLLSWSRFREHMPTANAIKFTVQHYGRLLGNKKFEMPPEDKYFESEKMAYILALAVTVTIILTGLLKAAAHVVPIPGAVMGVATPLHDVATLGMLAFFLAHIFFAAILPMGWPMLRSMFTGYVSTEHAKAEHAGWFARIEKASSETGGDAVDLVAHEGTDNV